VAVKEIFSLKSSGPHSPQSWCCCRIYSYGHLNGPDGRHDSPSRSPFHAFGTMDSSSPQAMWSGHQKGEAGTPAFWGRNRCCFWGKHSASCLSMVTALQFAFLFPLAEGGLHQRRNLRQKAESTTPQTVELRIGGARCEFHASGMPEFRLKQDVIPRRKAQPC